MFFIIKRKEKNRKRPKKHKVVTIKIILKSKVKNIMKIIEKNCKKKKQNKYRELYNAGNDRKSEYGRNRYSNI